MRYIRAKSGIYELNPLDYEGLMCVDGRTITTCVYTKDCEWVAKSEILKQSDTLEELFDAYVGVDDNGPHYMSKAVYKAFERKISKRNVYGAIWVFDGDDTPTLKPVAKMNEKGELELI